MKCLTCNRITDNSKFCSRSCANHIDGNFANNKEENLRLICWNCDSLGSTFGGANKGHGRKLRRR
jgi:hypothetical protein